MANTTNKGKSVIPGMTKLNECPKTLGCDSKSLWQDVEGGLWRFSQMDHTFLEHICRIPKNEKPEYSYMGEWFNKRTGRTRWITGTLLRSVKIAPVSRTAPKEEWELKNTFVSKLSWEKYHGE